MGLLSLVNNIARERGLDGQNYKCQGCSRPIGMSKYGLLVLTSHRTISVGDGSFKPEISLLSEPCCHLPSH